MKIEDITTDEEGGYEEPTDEEFKRMDAVSIYLNETRRYSLLSWEDEKELAGRIHAMKKIFRQRIVSLLPVMKFVLQLHRSWQNLILMMKK
jgi:hypothetical protein